MRTQALATLTLPTSTRAFALATTLAVLLAAGPHAARASQAGIGGAATAEHCTSLAQTMTQHWPDASTQIESVKWVPAGPVAPPPGPPGGPPPSTGSFPAHCELIGALQQRVGDGGQHYAIRFHVRLPAEWNGRLLFQGGAGSNGVLGDALGAYTTAAPAALQQGYAVLSQDSGHDNSKNTDPARGGIQVFGFDPQARANYGHASLPLATRAAKAVVQQLYGAPVRHAYFVGCSKGGEEGMALAQRYPAEFDGIVASAPGFSLPRAAVAEAWDTQSLAMAATGPLTLATLAHTFSNADLALVREAVLAACDADDGLKDGIVGDFAHCTAARVRPELDARTCSAAKAAGCLAAVQVSALSRLLGGVRDSQGHALYTDWAWDTGIAAPGWRVWKLGNEAGPPPAFNVILGGAALASDFTTPPTALPSDPQALLDFLAKFDFDRDAPRIYATNAQFVHSGWDDGSARSSDLSGFQRRKGRMIVTHGVSDPVFSIHDTLTWLGEVDQRQKGQAAQIVRVFPVPGMTHCGGGDATDRYDALASLVSWVEQGKAPESIVAQAAGTTPWPGRTRPLCPFPKVARYQGSGSIEQAANFSCK